jgi:RNA polymerase sigma-70 factor, ECF subfamily
MSTVTGVTESGSRELREDRFRRVFAHLAKVSDYARRRGSVDAEGVAAETMTIAWRRLDDVPTDDPRPWLYATARNLLYAEHRKKPPLTDVTRQELESIPEKAHLSAEVYALDSQVACALRALSQADREALLLVAWEDPSPRLAAAALGITPVAFRVRFHRARRRFIRAVAEHPSSSSINEPRMERA